MNEYILFFLKPIVILVGAVVLWFLINLDIRILLVLGGAALLFILVEAVFRM